MGDFFHKSILNFFGGKVQNRVMKKTTQNVLCSKNNFKSIFFKSSKAKVALTHKLKNATARLQRAKTPQVIPKKPYRGGPLYTQTSITDFEKFGNYFLGLVYYIAIIFFNGTKPLLRSV